MKKSRTREPRQSWLVNLTYAWWSLVTPLVNRELMMTPYPFHLTYVVTHLCDSHCIMCALWREKKGNELSVEEVRQIFANNDFSSLIALTLTGGEPTLRHDLADLLGTIIRACPRLRQVTLATNGLNPHRIVEQVKACLGVIPDSSPLERFSVQVSLDGTGKLHNHIRGVPDSYDRVMETLRLLKELVQQEPRLMLKLSSTIQPANVDSVAKLRALAEQLRLPVRFSALVFSPQYYQNIIEADTLCFTPEQAEQAATVFTQLADADPGANIKFYYRNVAQMLHGERRSQTCMMGYYAFVLEQDGNIYACVNCERRAFGNMRQQSFRELWRGAAARGLRHEIRTACCPTCTSLCYTFPANLAQVADVVSQRFVRKVKAQWNNLLGNSTKSSTPPNQGTNI